MTGDPPQKPREPQKKKKSSSAGYNRSDLYSDVKSETGEREASQSPPPRVGLYMIVVTYFAKSVLFLIEALENYLSFVAGCHTRSEDIILDATGSQMIQNGMIGEV